MIDVEKCYFNKSTIFPSTIGNVKFKYEGKTYSHFKDIKYRDQNGKQIEMESIKCDSKLMYDRLKNKYYLFAPVNIEKINEEKPNNIISIDPGVTNFINGISESSLIRVGEDVNKKIKDKLHEIDYILNKNWIFNGLIIPYKNILNKNYFEKWVIKVLFQKKMFKNYLFLN